LVVIAVKTDIIAVCSTVSTKYIWPLGLRCWCWRSDDLEPIVRQSSWSITP